MTNFPDINSLLSGNRNPNVGKFTDGSESASPDRIRDRVELIEDQERVQRIRALARPPAAPPPPVRVNYETPGIGAVKLTWNAVDDVRVYGYRIYGSAINNPNSAAPPIGFEPQPAEPNRDVVTYTDTIDAGDNQYYWVSSVNRAGQESARIPMHLGTPANTNTASVQLPIWEEGWPTIRILDGNFIDLYGANHWYQDTGAGAEATVSGVGFLENDQAGYPGILLMETEDSGAVHARARNLFAGMRTNSIGGRYWYMKSFMDFRFAAYTTVSNGSGDEDFRIGLAGPGFGPTGSPGSGVYFEKLGTDTNWFGVVIGGGTFRVDTGVAWDNTTFGWQSFRMRRIDSTTWGFTVDGATEVTQTESTPSTSQITPFLQHNNPNDAGASTTITTGLSRMVMFINQLGSKFPPLSL